MGTHRSSLTAIDQLVAHLGLGPWTRAELVGVGVSDAQVQRLLTQGLLRRVRRGLYALPDASERAEQLALPYDLRLARMRSLATGLTPDSAFSHDSATHIQSMWCPNLPSLLVHVTSPGGTARVANGLQIHATLLPEPHVDVLSGLRVTTVSRTAVDLALRGDLPAALVGMDSALRIMLERVEPGATRRLRGGKIPEAMIEAQRAELSEVGEFVRGWPGSRTVATAIAAADPRSESPFESWSRGWVVATGLPRPSVNRLVQGASGRAYYGDLVWEEYGLIGEADGLGKYGRTAAEVRASMRSERERQADLEAAGWRLARWASGESGAAIIARLGRALYLDPALIRGVARRGA